MAFMAPLAPWIAGASAAVGAVGAIQQGRAASAAANYNASVSERNAQIEEMQAAEDAERSRRATRRRLGAMRAAYGASGVALEGSPMDVLEDSYAEGELDALTIQYQGRMAAMNSRENARLERMRGRASKTAGYLKAGTSLLTGAANVASMV